MNHRNGGIGPTHHADAEDRVHDRGPLRTMGARQRNTRTDHHTRSTVTLPAKAMDTATVVEMALIAIAVVTMVATVATVVAIIRANPVTNPEAVIIRANPVTMVETRTAATPPGVVVRMVAMGAAVEALAAGSHGLK
jgi:hypothetical protein